MTDHIARTEKYKERLFRATFYGKVVCSLMDMQARIHFYKVQITAKKYEHYLRLVWKAKALQWRLDHLERLIIRNIPKSECDIYGIKK